jgi:hypothetical protein
MPPEMGIGVVPLVWLKTDVAGAVVTVLIHRRVSRQFLPLQTSVRIL